MSPKRRGPGRPKMKPREVRGVVFSTCLTEAERDTVKAAAARAGITASTWARDVLLAAAVKAQDDTRSA
jgi:hypothetical protein